MQHKWECPALPWGLGVVRSQTCPVVETQKVLRLSLPPHWNDHSRHGTQTLLIPTRVTGQLWSLSWGHSQKGQYPRLQQQPGVRPLGHLAGQQEKDADLGTLQPVGIVLLSKQTSFAGTSEPFCRSPRGQHAILTGDK